MPPLTAPAAIALPRMTAPQTPKVIAVQAVAPTMAAATIAPATNPAKIEPAVCQA
jgi:hypothetical protein